MSTPKTDRQKNQRQRKQAMAAAFQADCVGTEALFVAEYTGLDVEALSVLRAQARESGGRVRVVKNSVAKRVLAENPGLAPLADSLAGQLIYGTGQSAPSIAKVLKNFAKEHEELSIKAGVMDGSLIDASGVRRLADLPSREQMLGILAGALAAPIAKLARTLGELPASLARSLSAVRDAKANEEGGNA